MSTWTMLSSPHGVKRRGDKSLESEQRLSKRFDLLNLDHNGKLWVPARGVKSAVAPTSSRIPKKSTSGAPSNDETMQVDDTRDRVYIHNLDEELAGIETDSDEERIVFLPDIEKKFGKIPKHLLTGGDPSPQLQGNEIVLYSVPTSLSVPVEEDSVRKAIMESRARSRQEQQMYPPSRDASLHDCEQQTMHDMRYGGAEHSDVAIEVDEDSMDLG